MRILFFLVTLFSVQACMARPTVPVTHSHNGRVHQHSLPAHGLSHRHGSGAPGQLVDGRRNSGGIITSRVEYGGRNQPDPQASASRPTGLNFSKGDANCRRGEADCNMCVNNMRSQFQKAADGKIGWDKSSWRFNWPKKYPPYGLRPLDIFDGVPAYALGIPDTHVQGFVRTNSSQFPFAGSHSHKRRGGIFVVRQGANGGLELATLAQTKTRHPSAVHVIGKYLVYAEKNQLIFKNLNTPTQTSDYKLKIAKPSFGGGLGLTRLSRDNYLLITTGPGGQKSRPRYHRYYHLTFRNGRPQQLKYLSQSSAAVPSSWPKGFIFSENLSVMTECGTGDIYTIHTSGDEKGMSAIRGNGYWRLSRLESQGRKLGLRSLSAFGTRQNMSSCNLRAAATAHVNSQHKLELYCHGYAKDPDGSTFNVLGSSSRNADKFGFKVGTVY